jgi:hypothetical protein
MCVLPTDSATTRTPRNSNAVFSHISRDQILAAPCGLLICPTRYYVAYVWED